MAEPLALREEPCLEQFPVECPGRWALASRRKARRVAAGSVEAAGAQVVVLAAARE